MRRIGGRYGTGGRGGVVKKRKRTVAATVRKRPRRRGGNLGALAKNVGAQLLHTNLDIGSGTLNRLVSGQVGKIKNPILRALAGDAYSANSKILKQAVHGTIKKALGAGLVQKRRRRKRIRRKGGFLGLASLLGPLGKLIF